jgi:hypothetical protein
MSGETITIVRRTDTETLDAYNQPITTETSIEISGVAVALKGQSTEYQPGEALENDQITIYLPAGTEITNNDTVIVREVEYLLNGESFSWASPLTSWNPGVQVDLKRKGTQDGR